MQTHMHTIVNMIAARMFSLIFLIRPFSPFVLQLKKDKERLQAMMAHLKSSEPKAAAQPVSTRCDSLN